MLKRLYTPFCRFSKELVKRIPLERMSGQTRKLEEGLLVMKQGKKKQSLEEYYTNKLALVMGIVFWGTGLVLLAELAGGGIAWLEENRIERPAYGEGTKETELEVYMEGEEEKIRVSLQVEERTFTPEEVDELLEKGMESLESLLLGENGTLNEVRYDLRLPDQVEDGKVQVEWLVEPADLLDETGKILREAEEEGEVAELRASLACQGKEAAYQLYATVYPPKKGELDRFASNLQKQVEELVRENSHEDSVSLPQEVAGTQIYWAEEGESLTGVMILLLAAAAVGVFIGKDRELIQRAEKRRHQMILDYSDILFQLMMLLGAGLTIKAAFSKIASEYSNKPEKKERFAYEEMLSACHEMQSGVPEAEAYENFGRRCMESRYVKLGALLAQSLRKGSRGLAELLEQEAKLSMEERRNLAVKLGEEAGTKLLFPMVLMLVVVLIILMVPALMSM